MTIRSLIDAALVALAASLPGTLLASADDVVASHPVQQAIDGIVARSEAIFSARVAYQYHSVARRGDGTPIADHQLPLRLTVRGHDWILHYVDSPNFRMRRHDATLSYTESVANGQAPVRSLHIDGPITLRSLIYENAAHAAVRLGTLWFNEQAQFLLSQRNHAVRQADAVVDGVKTMVLDWKVSSPSFAQAMLVIPPRIAQARQGTLRLYAAPDLDYALPRIEYLTSSGDVDMQIDSTDFVQVADGVYFPRQVTCKTWLIDGEEVSEYLVRDVDYVNEAIPEAEFKLRVPTNTRVRDSRPGVPTSIFNLETQSQFDSIQRMLDGQITRRSMPSLRGVLLGVNLTLLILGLVIWSYRRWHTA